MLVWIPDIPGTHVHQLEFFIPGQPRPWKHGKPAIQYRGTGPSKKPFATVIDAPENQAYKPVIRHHFMRAVIRDGVVDLLKEPWTGHVMVTLHAYFKKPKDWYEGMVPDNANDVTNLKKIVEDALAQPHANTLRAEERKRAAKGFQAPREDFIYAWKNDAKIITGVDSKRYHDREGTIIVIDYYTKVEKPAKVPSPFRKPQPNRRKR